MLDVSSYLSAQYAQYGSIYYDALLYEITKFEFQISTERIPTPHLPLEPSICPFSFDFSANPFLFCENESHFFYSTSQGFSLLCVFSSLH